MTSTLSTLASLSDDALLAHVGTLAARERQATSDLVASLCELDARRLYLGAGCSSLFTYCTEVLHLSEHAAYGRIAAARAARRFPHVLDRLGDGSLTLTSVCLLAPVLTDQNAVELLDAARHKSKREVEHLVARVRPEPPVHTTVRKLPSPRQPAAPAVSIATHRTESACAGPSASEPPTETPGLVTLPAPARPAVVRPLAPETYKVQFTLSRDGYATLRRAQDLLRHGISNGDAGAIFERALTLLVEDLEKKKLAATDRPRVARQAKSDSRHVPAAVKREVWTRDGERCAFIGTHGRCTERGFLELHHVVPFADGGETSAGNLQLRCRAHNQHEAERWFGADVVRERPPGYASP